MRVMREGRWNGKEGRGRYGEHGNESRRVTTTPNVKEGSEGGVVDVCSGIVMHTHWYMGHEAQSSR